MKNGKMLLLGVLATVAALSVFGVLIQGCARTPDAPTEPSGSDIAGVIKPQMAENSLPAKLWAQFQQEITKKPEATAQELADVLVASLADQFSGVATQLEKDAEFFAGFDNYRITGYRDGAMYGPMIGSIAFVGYVFVLEDGTDPATFVKGLTDHCNPRWNVCVEAGQTACGAIGNRVFFVMCP
ncbi:MAG: hypothetical protein E7453_07440 [Ruminococcaceae bacterium]|nr:hypothetical protein [Oscillospiraceae bacterium]